MKKYSLFLMLMFAFGLNATNYYVSPDGNDSNAGTSISNPFVSISKGISMANAGDVIFVRGGEYKYSAKISLSRNGTDANPITLEAYQNEKPVIDFSGMSTNSSNRGFSLSGNYWVIKGMKVQYAGDNGMHVSGNFNTIENCVFFANRDTGLQLGNGASNNKILNCDSYGNADPTDYGDADGFACKLDVGDNNYFYGCRAWLNVDDGWDGYMKEDLKPNTIVENCWTWMNGYFLDGSDAGAAANGNGFKVGGSDNRDMDHNFTLIDCVSFDNKAKGFDQNNNTGTMKFYNCTGFRNKGNNFSIPRALNAGNTAEVKNCVAIDGKVSLGSFVIQQNNTWNSGFSVSSSDFLSIDTTGVSGPRQPDGSLPELNLFHLKESSLLIDAGIDLGYAYFGNSPDLGAFESNYGATGIFLDTIDNNCMISLLNNPVNTDLRFKLELQADIAASEVQILSMSGNVIQHHLITNTPHHELYTFNVSGIVSGMYLLGIRTNKGICYSKFIKL